MSALDVLRDRLGADDPTYQQLVVSIYAAAACAFLSGLLAGFTLAIWWWG